MALPGATLTCTVWPLSMTRKRLGLVVEAHRLQVDRDAAADVDRALPLAVGARRELGLQLAPGLRARRRPRSSSARRGRRRGRGAAAGRFGGARRGAPRPRVPRAGRRGRASRVALATTRTTYGLAALGRPWPRPGCSASRSRSVLHRVGCAAGACRRAARRRLGAGAWPRRPPARPWPRPAGCGAAAAAAPAHAAPAPGPVRSDGERRGNAAWRARRGQRRIGATSLVPYRPARGRDLSRLQAGWPTSRGLTQIQATRPMPIMRQRGQRPAPAVECITSGASTPATSAVGQAAHAGLHRRGHAAPVGHQVQHHQRDHRHHQRPAEGEHRHRQHAPRPACGVEQQVQRHVEQRHQPA